MDLDILRRVKDSDVGEFSLKGNRLVAKIVDIYDGDTIKAVFYMPGTNELVKFSCRLVDIDAAELRRQGTSSFSSSAYAARNRLCELVTSCSTPLPAFGRLKNHIDKENTKLVTLICGDFDKYGRLVVKIESEDGDINLTLLEEGHCVKL